MLRREGAPTRRTARLARRKGPARSRIAVESAVPSAGIVRRCTARCRATGEPDVRIRPRRPGAARAAPADHLGYRRCRRGLVRRAPRLGRRQCVRGGAHEPHRAGSAGHLARRHDGHLAGRRRAPEGARLARSRLRAAVGSTRTVENPCRLWPFCPTRRRAASRRRAVFW